LRGLEARGHKLVVVDFAIAVSVDFRKNLLQGINALVLLLEHSEEFIYRQESVAVGVYLLE